MLAVDSTTGSPALPFLSSSGGSTFVTDHVCYRPLELAELLPGHHSARWPGGGRLFWSALGFGRLLRLARLKTGIDAYLYELGATQVFTLSR